MPDDETDHVVPNPPSPEAQAFVEELRAAGYDNPEVYISPGIRQLFNLRIVAPFFEDYPTTIHATLDADVLWAALTEQIFYLFSLQPDVKKVLESHGDRSITEFRERCDEYPEFALFREAQLKFFLRHFPELLLRIYNVAVLGSFLGPWLYMYRQQPDGDLNDMEKLARTTLEAQIKDLGKHIKRIVETRSKGRPSGSTKPQGLKELERLKEATEFQCQIEAAIRTLTRDNGVFPTKTAVAKALGIGGLNRNTGVDSSLTAFNNKLRRLEIDYNLIVARVQVNK